MSGIVNENNICNNVNSLHSVSAKYNIDSDLYVSMLWVESNFKTDIKSYTGKACGISQVVPKWTRPRLTCKELNQNPDKAMDQGARIFSIFKKYGRGNVDMSLCGYNQGYRCKGEYKKDNGYDPIKTGMEYAGKVKRFRRRLKREMRRKKKEVDSLLVHKHKLVRAINSIYKL